jgi:hypothetical protein
VARAAALIVALAAGVAGAAGPCDEGRDRTGLGMAVREGRLVVDAVAPNSAAAASGVRAGDVVLQANGTIAHACAEWARVVEEAREERKAVLLLVARGDVETPLALGRRTWGEEEAAAVAAAPAPRAAVAVETPAPLPADVPVSVDSVVTELAALLGQTRVGLEPYRTAVTASRRAVETLAVRKAASTDTVAALRRVARLHETAVYAWEGIEGIRQRDGIARRLPISDAATAPYYSGSPIQSLLDEFDFLRETVVTEPRGSRFVERAGEWRPAAARRLAWEHAGEELGRVTASLQ